MVSVEAFRVMVAGFEDVIVYPHFDKTAFKAGRTFATLDGKANRVCLMLTEADQYVFCKADAKSIYRVPNKWGTKGATYFELKTISKSLLKDALDLAYQKALEGKSGSTRKRK